MEGVAVKDDLFERGKGGLVEVEDLITVQEYEKSLSRMKNGESQASMESLWSSSERVEKG